MKNNKKKKSFIYLIGIAFLGVLLFSSYNTIQQKSKNNTTMDTAFYQFTAVNLYGDTISMNDYKGKIILVVNTASKCGFTPQFEGLEKLYKKYKDQGFIILGFPCNQFANQEPGDEKAIGEFCTLNYGVTFPMFSKIDVNGKNTHPIYKYLKNELGGFLGSKIKWNFTKFLIGTNGKPIKRFAPTTKPEEIDIFIAQMLDKK